jgi:L-amino acid N-acyltransferase YncA
MEHELTIENMSEYHWNDVMRIYDSGIASGNATFEMHVPDWNSWDRSHLKECRLIARSGSIIAGWAALSPVSERKVYAGVAEVSIYIDPEFRGLGIGNRLMAALIRDSEQSGIWTLQAGIFPENEISLKLHLKNGFRVVGKRERIGKMGDLWRDVILVERRSDKIG